ncbi:hypothetical protein [Mesorhizobium sp.]|uniref:hypothetical protein n=1 Tax=Mesorhizobium sp. TaxID=1871066 RepID=UPI000FE30EFA|nr:hypothetical protein [Mesorhizobium sp.]RWK33783.1 MAG: hypothetical protein EOR40_19745 [Mesorhizobium sp.]
MTTKPQRTTEIKPGVNVDMSEFGRTPDAQPLDMSHLNYKMSDLSVNGKLNQALGIESSEHVPTKPI